MDWQLRFGNHLFFQGELLIRTQQKVSTKSGSIIYRILSSQYIVNHLQFDLK